MAICDWPGEQDTGRREWASGRPADVGAGLAYVVPVLEDERLVVHDLVHDRLEHDLLDPRRELERALTLAHSGRARVDGCDNGHARLAAQAWLQDLGQLGVAVGHVPALFVLGQRGDDLL